MSLCKYGCGEEVTFIDGKPYSLQNHMKVCSKGNAGKKRESGGALNAEQAEAILHLQTLRFPVREATAMVVQVSANLPVEEIIVKALEKAGAE